MFHIICRSRTKNNCSACWVHSFCLYYYNIVRLSNFSYNFIFDVWKEIFNNPNSLFFLWKISTVPLAALVLNPALGVQRRFTRYSFKRTKKKMEKNHKNPNHVAPCKSPRDILYHKRNIKYGCNDLRVRRVLIRTSCWILFRRCQFEWRKSKSSPSTKAKNPCRYALSPRYST